VEQKIGIFCLQKTEQDYHFHKIPGLKSKNLRSVVMLPLGYRAAEGDWLVNLKKVRRGRDSFVTEIK
jgi:nitroreductase